jgi:hypothetical protein
MGNIAHNMQEGIKTSSKSMFVFSVRLLTGLVLSLTLALVGQEIIGYGDFAFAFVIVVCTGLFMRASSNWGLAWVLIFDLICFLVALLLRMYLLVAP